MKTIIYLFIATVFLVTAVSCSEEEKLVESGLPSTDPTTPEPETEPGETDITAGALLYFKLGTRWESYPETEPYENWGKCEVLPLGPTDVECQLTVPEAQMFYSSTQFKIGTLAATSCPIITFYPYYYKRSDKATVETTVDGNTTITDGYLPPGAKETEFIACDGDTEEKKCFGGAATELISDFPKNTGSYFLSNVMNSTSYVLNSENKIRSNAGRSVNYLLTNDLSATNRAIAVTSGWKERVADNYSDYEVHCKNYWGENLYSIKVIISDENMDGIESGTSHDDYIDWN